MNGFSFAGSDVWILTDYRGAFYSTIRNRWGICSLDLDFLCIELNKNGLKPTVIPYADVDLRKMDFNNKMILYQSTEDPGSQYKSYQEDILLGIFLQGGILIPSFRYMKAHHNKVFMEILRDISKNDEFQNIISRQYGTWEEFRKKAIDSTQVIKSSWGAGSGGVQLARSKKEAMRITRKISRSDGLTNIIKEKAKRIIRKKNGYVPFSLNRSKFITQDFIPGMFGDFKVLVYWDRYYVLCRKNRPGDFRASGSGRLDWPENPPKVILQYARRLFDYFRVPVAAFDIGLSKETPYLFECQFVSFGPLAMEQSQWYFHRVEGQWERVKGVSKPETELARSITEFIKSGKCQHRI